MSITLDFYIANDLFFQDPNPQLKDLDHYLYLKSKNPDTDKYLVIQKDFTADLHKCLERKKPVHFSKLIEFIILNDIKVKIDSTVYSMFPIITKDMLEMSSIEFDTFNEEKQLTNIQIFRLFLSCFFNPNRFFIQHNSYWFSRTVEEIKHYLLSSCDACNVALTQQLFYDINTLQYFYDYEKPFLLELKDRKGFDAIRNKFIAEKF